MSDPSTTPMLPSPGDVRGPRATVSEHPPLPGDARAAIRRELEHRPQVLDDHGVDAYDVNALVSLPSGDLEQWIDTRTAEEARNLYAHLDAVAREHRRRAEAANTLVESLRQRFAYTASYDPDAMVAASPVRG